MRRKPLSVRNEVDRSREFVTLAEGIEPWMRTSLINWTQHVLEQARMTVGRNSLESSLERYLQIELDWGHELASARAGLFGLIRASDSSGLDLIDACLLLTDKLPGKLQRVTSLRQILEESNSVWMVFDVVGEPASLIRRVDTSVAEAAMAEMTIDSRAGKHLSLAWRAAYRIEPDASATYRESVRAVEAELRPVVAPNNPKATLGTMIGDVHSKPSKWAYSLGGAEKFVQILEQLWHSQFDRHGTDDESIPLQVSIEQARTALHLSLAVVQIVRSGHFNTQSVS